MLQPLLSPVLDQLFQPVVGGTRRGGAAAPFNPLSLFAAGEQGAWYDVSDLSSMFQDSAGTIPAVVDSPVGRINDKSGRGNPAMQFTAPARPYLRLSEGLYFLDFDGIDDGLATISFDLTATDKITVFAALRRATDAATVVAEMSSNYNNRAAFILYTTAGSFEMGMSEGGGKYSVVNVPDGINPSTSVTTYQMDRSLTSGQIIARRNGVAAYTVSLDDDLLGNFGDFPLNIGSRDDGAGLAFTGRIYGFIVRGAASTALEISNTESLLAAKCGVTL